MGIKVALDGQGADELLAGYKHYHLNLLFEHLTKGYFKSAKEVMGDFLSGNFIQKLTLSLRNNLPESGKRLLRDLYGYGFICKHDQIDKFQLGESYDQKFKALTLAGYLWKQHTVGLKNLLYYGDIVSMANSVENRSPFMDHRLVDYAFRTSPELKVKNGLNKYALRKLDSFRKFRHVLIRKKVGFNTTVPTNIKIKEIKSYNLDLLCDHGLVNRKGFKKFISSNSYTHPKFERLVFRLIQVNRWFKLFYEK